ncbi:hypothetical protein QYE76_070452 [Lolium multiflorum]|uniref:Uncharacterized protein n=1 Tax=Lolium multiflorum TaxID=4521 RepID=A0AAD8SK73_LOLMU|nr:hypothetical protein QYE76_070452 [Lolium multiflorum]
MAFGIRVADLEACCWGSRKVWFAVRDRSGDLGGIFATCGSASRVRVLFRLWTSALKRHGDHLGSATLLVIGFLRLWLLLPPLSRSNQQKMEFEVTEPDPGWTYKVQVEHAAGDVRGSSAKVTALCRFVLIKAVRASREQRGDFERSEISAIASASTSAATAGWWGDLRGGRFDFLLPPSESPRPSWCDSGSCGCLRLGGWLPGRSARLGSRLRRGSGPGSYEHVVADNKRTMPYGPGVSGWTTAARGSRVTVGWRGSGSQPSKPSPKKRTKPSPASVPITPEVEVPPKASSATKPDPKDVINVDDLPEGPTDHGDSGKGASSSAPPPEQPAATSAEPTAEQYEQKVQLIHASGMLQAHPPPSPSLQKLPLSQRHAEVSAMMEKSTRKLHEDLRVHVLEQMTEIEGLRRNAENSQKAIKHLETRLNETAKHSTHDSLSAKVKVLEAENESLKAFIDESSEKEILARKELSEKHARDLAELTDKLKKSQHRVTSLVAKNKVQEAGAEAIDKMIFPSLGFEWSKESALKRTEAYDEARSSIDSLVGACREIAKSLSLKRAKTTVMDTMTKLMKQVPELIKDWQESSARGVASLVMATCKAHFPAMKFADIARDPPKGANMRAILAETKGFDRLFVARVNHSFWYHKYDLPKGFVEAEIEEEGAEEEYYEEGSGSSTGVVGEGSEENSDAGSDEGSDDDSAYVASDEDPSSK